MQMFQIEMEMNESGELVLTQHDGGEDSMIFLHPDQVPLVCEWMMKTIGARTETRDVQRLQD